MKPTKYITISCLTLTLAGCAITGGMQRRHLNAGLNYVPKPPVESVAAELDAPPPSQRIEYTTAQGEKKHLYFGVKSVNYKGEKIAEYNIETVVVKAARSRTLTERGSKVFIDFVITLPKQLQGDCQSIAVIPLLHNRTGVTPLDGLTIRGELFGRVQDRNYWQYEQYCNLFKPDLTGRERAFQRFVKNPYPKGARLDSIIESRNTLSYYYTQQIETRDVGKQVRITLEGSVKALDRSSYRLPLSDTLVYNIASMLAFVDTTKRHITQVIEKYAVACLSVRRKGMLSTTANCASLVCGYENIALSGYLAKH